MVKVKLKKKGKKLESIRASVKKLDGQTVKAGYFASQGKHLGGSYSYAALAQALELGYFPVQGFTRVPMPFMNHIGNLTYKGLSRDAGFKKALKAWIKKLDKKGNPKALLDSMGMAAKKNAYHVFNNPAYFPQAPNNRTPNFETGALRSAFSYKTSWDNQVRRT